MANRRILVKRRKAVRNIRKITRTMQLIATARFQAAFQRAVATRPYAEKIAELVVDLSEAAGQVQHPLLVARPEAERQALMVITSNRGFCGSYNANLLRLAIEQIDASSDGETDIYMVGRKGITYFRFLRREVLERITSVSDAPRFDQVEPLANNLMARFARGEIASARVVYMRFVSAGQQQATVLPLLPLSRDAAAQPAETEPRRKADYEFSPDPQRLLDELLPATVRVRLFQCFTDATVSEQMARMVAMKAATDAAGDAINAITQQYNRARQTAITMELLDIVGGANAVA